MLTRLAGVSRLTRIRYLRPSFFCLLRIDVNRRPNCSVLPGADSSIELILYSRKVNYWMGLLGTWQVTSWQHRKRCVRKNSLRVSIKISRIPERNFESRRNVMNEWFSVKPGVIAIDQPHINLTQLWEISQGNGGEKSSLNQVKKWRADWNGAALDVAS